MIYERQKTLNALKKRLKLVNQAIQTLEILARTEQQQTEAAARSNCTSARQYAAQHRKRGGEQSQR